MAFLGNARQPTGNLKQAHLTVFLNLTHFTVLTPDILPLLLLLYPTPNQLVEFIHSLRSSSSLFYRRSAG